jgi:cold shock CspA family protein
MTSKKPLVEVAVDTKEGQKPLGIMNSEQALSLPDHMEVKISHPDHEAGKTDVFISKEELRDELGRSQAKRTTTSKTLKKGDKVSWDTSQGATQGKIVKKQTTATKIKGHQVKASKDNPQYIAESNKSGKRAAHKPQALRKLTD